MPTETAVTDVLKHARRSDMAIGFGGFKQSRIGREDGVNGLRAYLEPKTIIMENRT